MSQKLEHLQQELAQLQREKQRLQISLETVAEHADLVEHQLLEAQQQLETKVAERTQELEEKNQLLEREIKERERMEHDLRHAKDRAEIANRAKTSFLANMSHELRTPLNAIIGYSDMLIEDSEDLGDAELTEDLYNIRTAGEHLLKLISDILDISKIESEQLVLDKREFIIAEFIHDVAALIQPNLRDNQLRIRCSDPLGSFYTDPTRLEQILLNLLNNALKFTHRGIITLGAERTAGTLCFRVKDTGIGIAPEQLEEIFQAFQQADNSTTRRYGGMGIGLSLCRQLSNVLGAHIRVESKLGEGSQFQVCFPIE